MPQRWRGTDGDLHRHRQHAAADPGSGDGQRDGFPETRADSAELPGSDRGE